MTKTMNYNLNKPEATDPLRLADFNGNADIIDTALAGCARVECGTYTGTHTYGSSSPNTLTFGIAPKIVFVFTVSTEYGSMANTAYTGNAMGENNVVFYYGGSKYLTYSSGTGLTHYTLSGNTLTWYNTQSAWLQLNGNNTTYGYIAIG